MTVRRALCASPLAVLVAVCAHLVAFGFGHAPGAERASALLEALGAALALGVCGAFAAGLLGADAKHERDASVWCMPLFLAAAGTASFGCIEYSEGHFALRTLFEAALLSIPLAYFVALVARSTRSAIRGAGAACGEFVCRTRARHTGSLARFVCDAITFSANSIVTLGSLRGRAPPAFI
jgi:hypothetical protein